ncbi:hypothetical protein QFW82_29800 [Streptomyces malaysiensis subsp. malaysiensis]|uniref:hypothetical protein n=1 Tax=Streptomyces malaysiensis TaxID=92644 RepID=UPI0024C03C44|nr:hypothetical protein [Streptomyces sp. NA07423]WHX20935.1 hypothetical protein QFW82_29800 [Streptomyces sp. NA07423]
MPSYDGGHHAIKGFAFQFDASLLQVLANPTETVELEGAQDIGVQCYHIQVKHRSSNYHLSRISRAVQQMMEQFASNQRAKLILYCHFTDQTPGTTLKLSKHDLDKALDKHADKYSDDTKDWFIKSFTVVFAADFQTQFRTVLDQLRRVLRARNEVEAICWHAVIHSHLRDVIFERPMGERKISLNDLKDLVHDARAAVFEASYAQICGHAEYLQLLRNEYKSRTAHIPPIERLFIVEYDSKTHTLDLVDIAASLQRRYFAGTSPAPYISFRGPTDLTEIKHALWQSRLHFHDGFDYGGAEFSPASIVSPQLPGYGIKLLDFAMLDQLTDHMKMHEVHDFYLTNPAFNPFDEARVRHAIIESPTDLFEIFRGRV